MSADHEEWTGLIKDSRHLHYTENSMRRKGSKLYLRNSGEILRSIDCAEQHAKIADRQQQRGPSPFKAHNEMLQSFI